MDSKLHLPAIPSKSVLFNKADVILNCGIDLIYPVWCIWYREQCSVLLDIRWKKRKKFAICNPFTTVLMQVSVPFMGMNIRQLH